jgi:hypothetical protein
MLDPTFNPGADGVIYGLTVQSDGKILVGGSFGFLDGKPRSRLGRLINTDPITESLTFDGSTITWLRGGSSPEVLRTSFDASLDGINWMTLGNGQRIPGGWNISGLNLPTTTIIRARGFVTGGRYCSSIWFVESTLNLSPNRPPVILTENAHFGFVSNKFGFDVAGLTLGGVVVDASTNFSVWTPLWTNFLGNGPVYFADPRSTNFPRRFYRARLQ